jgi:phosphoribosyl-ATP pyrophosphohydrolase
MAKDTLERLAATLHQRRIDPAAAASYTRQLLDGGIVRCAKKLGEEATETVIAAVHQDDTALKAEAADLLYHLLVVLEARSIGLADVYDVLESRMGRSGLDEKAARNKGGPGGA